MKKVEIFLEEGSKFMNEKISTPGNPSSPQGVTPGGDVEKKKVTRPQSSSTSTAPSFFQTLRRKNNDFVRRGSLMFSRPKIVLSALENPETSFPTILQTPQCKDMRDAVARFLNGFERKVKGMTLDQEAEVLRNFLSSAEYTMRVCPPWNHMPPEKFVLAKESMKRHVFGHLYNIVFFNQQLQEHDAKFTEHVAKLKLVVTPETVEISNSVDDTLVQRAAQELEGMDTLFTPYEKLACILNACKVVLFSLQSFGSIGGADDFLPSIIYLLIKANLPHVFSNTSFIGRFAGVEDRNDEAYCYYTHLVSASMYIETMPAPAEAPTETKTADPQPIAISTQVVDQPAPSQGSTQKPVPTPVVSPVSTTTPVAPTTPSSPAPSASQPWLLLKRTLSRIQDRAAAEFSSPSQRTQTPIKKPDSTPRSEATPLKAISPVSFEDDYNGLFPMPVTLDLFPTLSPCRIGLDSMVYSISPVGRGEVWVGSFDGKIHIFRESTEFVCTVPIHHSPIRCICPSIDSVWLSSDEGTLYGVNVFSHRVSQMESVHDKNHPSVCCVIPVRQDRTSCIIASIAHSLTVKSSQVALLSVSIFTPPGSSSGSKGMVVAVVVVDNILPGQTVTCAVLHDDTLWLGCLSGKILILESSTLNVVREVELSSPEPSAVMCIVSGERTLWVGTQRSTSIVSIDGKTGLQLSVLTTVSDSPIHNDAAQYGNLHSGGSSTTMTPCSIRSRSTSRVVLPGAHSALPTDLPSSVGIAALCKYGQFLFALPTNGEPMCWDVNTGSFAWMFHNEENDAIEPGPQIATRPPPHTQSPSPARRPIPSTSTPTPHSTLRRSSLTTQTTQSSHPNANTNNQTEHRHLQHEAEQEPQQKQQTAKHNSDQEWPEEPQHKDTEHPNQVTEWRPAMILLESAALVQSNPIALWCTTASANSVVLVWR
ncbi:vacuolar assembly/sorting protein VPS9 [Pelomyxa schiedti]|nr:vacuolar assembly/sorting protein VPS9 [Pelomyxa schiedti]